MTRRIAPHDARTITSGTRRLLLRIIDAVGFEIWLRGGLAASACPICSIADTHVHRRRKPPSPLVYCTGSCDSMRDTMPRRALLNAQKSSQVAVQVGRIIGKAVAAMAPCFHPRNPTRAPVSGPSPCSRAPALVRMSQVRMYELVATRRKKRHTPPRESRAPRCAVFLEAPCVPSYSPPCNSAVIPRLLA